MTKDELLRFANKGKTEINGIPLEVVVYPSSLDGTPWLEIHVDPLSPLHQPLLLGQKWVEYITDEECAEFPAALLKYKEEAEQFCEQAKRVVKGALSSDGMIKLTEIPESVKSDWDSLPPKAFKDWAKSPHQIRYLDNQKAWHALGNFTLDLDGRQYEPHWSYWLDCPYYITK